MRAVRALLLLIGVAATVQGIRLLLDQGGENLRATLTWLVGGVILHDGVIAPITIAVAAALTLLGRRRVPAPVIVGAVVLMSVTLLAVPVLGRYGARPDNATLLDRNYWVGWWVFAGLTLLGVGIGLVRDRRTKGADRGARARGR